MTGSLSSRFRMLIDREISTLHFGDSPASLYEPISYLMGLEGKRVRPVLTLLSYNLFKRNPEKILRYALALEVFHNFSLMHDDVMDNSSLRRGKATVHKKWNISTAILSGDVMLVKTYELFGGLDPMKFRKVITAFNRCATAVCEGQQMDMEFESRKTVSADEYIRMVELKTGELLGFSLELGALLAGAPLKTCKALRSVGINIGVAFQLTDDLLDVYGTSEKFGKVSGGDIVANKKTFLLIKALELSKPGDKKKLGSWLTAKSSEPAVKINSVKEIYDRLQVDLLTRKEIDKYLKSGTRLFRQIGSKGKAGNEIVDIIGKLAHRQT